MLLLKVIREYHYLIGGDGFRLTTHVAELLTGYFKNAMQPVICLTNEGRVIPPTVTLAGSVEKRPKTDPSRSTEAYAGIIEATDEEIEVSRSAGYEIRDLRNLTISEFLREVGVVEKSN